MIYTVEATKRFRDDLKKMKKRGKSFDELYEMVGLLAEGKDLPLKCKDHALTGGLKGFREFHLEGDWVVVYTKNEGKLILTLAMTGTHRDVFPHKYK